MFAFRTLTNLLSILIFFLSLHVFAKSSSEQAAKKALNSILSAYSEGQIANVETLIDPVMIGYQQLLDSMRLSSAKQKQIRIQLHDTQITTAKDIVVIRTGWDKRYLNVPDMAPVVSKGQTLFLMQLFKNVWKLTSQSGDNIFAK